MEALLKDRRVVYVTGKGGVGKTTVAAALGLAAAEAGRRTIVCEVAEQDRVSRAFRREGVTAETEVQLAENLWAITIDPTKALQEWLAKQLGGGAPLRMMTRSHAFQYFVAAAPGAKELITIAKVWELAQLSRWDARNRTYDLVVVDAPASDTDERGVRAAQSGVAVLVVARDRTRNRELTRLVDRLRSAGAQTVGFVLTGGRGA
jgi:anion-transporting  ArsA/GET3 family ATPase